MQGNRCDTGSGLDVADLDLVLHDIDALCCEHFARISAAIERASAPALNPADAQSRIGNLRELHRATATLAEELEMLVGRTALLDVSPEVSDSMQGQLLSLDLQLRRISARLRPTLLTGSPPPDVRQAGSGASQTRR